MEDDPQQEEEAKKTLRETVSAIKYCHTLAFSMETRNPSFSSDAEGNVKVTDIGLAIKSRQSTLLKLRCGTKSFNAQ